MSCLILISVAYKVPTIKDAEEVKKLILKDNKNTFIKILENIK